MANGDLPDTQQGAATTAAGRDSSAEALS